MPQFSYQDRQVLGDESALWACRAILMDCTSDNAWTKRIAEIRKSIEVLAKEIQHYNDQFEGED